MKETENKIMGKEKLLSLTQVIKFAVFLCFILGCDILDNKEGILVSYTYNNESVKRNVKLWNKMKPIDFEYVFKRDCYCIPEFTIPVYVSIKDGRIVKAHHNGILTSDQQGGYVWSIKPMSYSEEEFEQFRIEKLFKTVDEALNLNPDEHLLDFDDSLGYPIDVYFDFNKIIADDEISYRISEFKVFHN